MMFEIFGNGFLIRPVSIALFSEKDEKREIDRNKPSNDVDSVNCNAFGSHFTCLS